MEITDRLSMLIDDEIPSKINTKNGGFIAYISEETEYQKFFNGKLKKYGVTSPDELEGEKKKAFFDEIDAGWKGKKEMSESVSLSKLSKGEREGLLSWVKDYQTARKHSPKMAKSIKKSIDLKIRQLRLDTDEVYFYYGDPDDPKNK